MNSSNQATRGRLFIIAHRLTTVRDADRIVVLGEGDNGMGGPTQIVESGTHKELMDLDGTYAALVGAQAAKGTSEPSLSSKDPSQPLRSVSVDSDGRIVGSAIVANGSAAELDAIIKTGDDDGDDGKEDDLPEIKVEKGRIWSYVKGNKHIVIGGVVAAMLNGCTFPAISIAFAEMLQAYVLYDPDELSSETLKWAAFFWSVAALHVHPQYAQVWLFSTIGETLTQRVALPRLQSYPPPRYFLL